MHLGFHEPVWFKLNKMIDTARCTDRYILILVFLTVTLIQGHRDSRRENFSANYLPKLSVDLDGIWHAVEACWSDKSHTQFILSGL